VKTADFDFALPEDRIAQTPAKPRDSARLLVVREALEDRRVRDLPAILRPGDVMVFNDTKVIPAQLRGTRGEAGIDVTLLRRDAGDARLWQALARPAKKLKVGDGIVFEDLQATVVGKQEAGEIALRFACDADALMAAIHRLGTMPLPPYIRKLRPVAKADEADYQTVYAQREGAVAAPTAGLHFTPELLAALDARGIERVNVTLHVGAGTFLPVKADNLADHKMHSEWGEVTAATVDAVNRARGEGRRIVAVGTTSLRLLESALDADGVLRPFDAETAIFIHPGKTVRSTDVLLTNFHLPKSTLFMLVCAFAGTARMRTAYQHAIDTGYRFFSYGDACLLERAA
jgi:S-adenosylmethionine:tRNA ribosyltransferase-isomerase